MAINTVQDLALWARDRSADEIHEEIESLPQSVRDSILEFASPESPEPVRSALNTIGRVYGVASLINY